MEFEGARGLNTRTSKKALSFREPQKPSAATSKRAPSELTVEAGRFCPDTGFNVGSVQTLEHTSEIKDAVISLTSLWRKEGKPPFAHDKACSTENDLLHHRSDRNTRGGGAPCVCLIFLCLPILLFLIHLLTWLWLKFRPHLPGTDLEKKIGGALGATRENFAHEMLIFCTFAP